MQCIELLKAMLQMDADMRIIPSEVLSHPFITNQREPSAIVPLDDGNQSGSLGPKFPCCKRMVQPATTENVLHLEDEDAER